MTQGTDNGAVNPRGLLRLLRILEAGGGEAALHKADEPGRCRIAHRGRMLTFPVEMIDQCVRDGLILLRQGRAQLEPAGRAKLRRLLHPDAGYLVQHVPLAKRTIDLSEGMPGGAPGEVQRGLPVGRQEVTVNEGESPLARLYARKRPDGASWLSRSEFAAGEKLRGDFERARLQPRMGAAWDRPITGGGKAAELSDFALDARDRVETALDRLEPELAGVSLDVCCFLKGLEQVERERRWPPRSAKLMLRAALSILARHYGFEASADGGRRKVVHWGDAGYRPGL